MSLAALNSQYLGLNGLSGYGGMGATGLYNGANTEVVKDNIANAYDISATSNSYANKASVSSSSFAQQCQTISYLLQNGRGDEAMDKYNKLYEDMASNSYYEGYNENQIKTLLQEQYINATGTSIVNDIEGHGNSAFMSSLGNSMPGIGLLFESSSKDDFIAKATGTGTSNASKVESVLGSLSGAAVSGGVGALTGALIGAKGKHSKGGAIAGAIIGAASSIITSIAGKVIKSK